MSQPPSSTSQSRSAMSAMEFESTLTFFRLLKVAQLKDLCKSVGLALKGKKQDLLERLESYARSCFAAGEIIRLLAIRSVVLKMLNHDPVPDFHNLCNALQSGLIDFQSLSQQNMQENIRLTSGMGQVQNRKLPSSKVSNPMSGGYSSGNSSHGSIYYPKYSGPMLLFPSTLFYQLIRMVHGFPYMMIASKGRNVCNVSVSLNAEEIELLQSDPTARLYLFSGLSSTPNPAKTPIQFPPIEIHVDGINTKQYVKGLKGKPGTCRPADLTKFIPNLNRQFTVNVVYSDAAEPYILYIYIVRASSPENLVERIQKEGNHIPIEVTKRAIQQDYEQNQDDDIVMDTSSISLRCPLTYARMKYPMKSTSCDHVQCFDGLSFLTMQERIPSWICPVCSAQLDQNSLAVSDYMNDILRNTSEDVESVMLNTDGSWAVQTEADVKNESSAPPRSPSAVPAPAEPSVEPANESIEVISLDSDSEEESEPLDSFSHPAQPASLGQPMSPERASPSPVFGANQPSSSATAGPGNSTTIPQRFSSSSPGSHPLSSEPVPPRSGGQSMSPPNASSPIIPHGQQSGQPDRRPSYTSVNGFNTSRPQMQPQKGSSNGSPVLYSDSSASPDARITPNQNQPTSTFSRAYSSNSNNQGWHINRSASNASSGMSGVSGMSGMSGGSYRSMSGVSGANILSNMSRGNSIGGIQSTNLPSNGAQLAGKPNSELASAPSSSPNGQMVANKPRLPARSPSFTQIHGQNQSLPLPSGAGLGSERSQEAGHRAIETDDSSDNEPLARRREVAEDVSLANIPRRRPPVVPEDEELEEQSSSSSAQTHGQLGHSSAGGSEQPKPFSDTVLPSIRQGDNGNFGSEKRLRLPPIVAQQQDQPSNDVNMSPPPESGELAVKINAPMASPPHLSPIAPQASMFGQNRLPSIGNLTPGLNRRPESRNALYVPWARDGGVKTTSSQDATGHPRGGPQPPPLQRPQPTSVIQLNGSKEGTNGEKETQKPRDIETPPTMSRPSSTKPKSPAPQLSKIGSVIEKIQEQYSRRSSPNPESSKAPEKTPPSGASENLTRPAPTTIQKADTGKAGENSSSAPSIQSVYDISDNSNEGSSNKNARISPSRTQSYPSVAHSNSQRSIETGLSDRPTSEKQHSTGSLPELGSEAVRQNAIAERYRKLISTSSVLINNYNRMALDPNRAISSTNGIPVRPSRPNSSISSSNGIQSADSAGASVKDTAVSTASKPNTQLKELPASGRPGDNKTSTATEATTSNGVNLNFRLNTSPQEDHESSVSVSPSATDNKRGDAPKNGNAEQARVENKTSNIPGTQVGEAARPPAVAPSHNATASPEKLSDNATQATQHQPPNNPSRGDVYSKSAFDVLTEEEALQKIKGVLGIEISGNVFRSKSPFAALPFARENSEKQAPEPSPLQTTPMGNRIQEHANGESTTPIDNRIERMTIETPNEKKRSISNSSSERSWNKRLSREPSKKFDPSEINSSQIIELDD